MRWRDIVTRLLTIGTGLLLLHMSAASPEGASGSGMPCSAEAPASSYFRYPTEDGPLQPDDDYVFAIAPVDGATAYRWEIEQEGKPIVDAVERTDGPSELGYDLWHTLAYAGEPSALPELDSEVGPPILIPGLMFAIETGTPTHDEIRAGTLTATVSAAVCDRWIPVASTTVEVACPSIHPSQGAAELSAHCP